jgi:hypothetical protein
VHGVGTDGREDVVREVEQEILHREPGQFGVSATGSSRRSDWRAAKKRSVSRPAGAARQDRQAARLDRKAAANQRCD